MPTATASNPLVEQRFDQGMSIAQGALTANKDFVNAILAFINTIQPLQPITPISPPVYEQLATQSLSRPSAPVIDFPDLPITDLVAPSSSFDYQDVPYTSELANVLESLLLDRLANGGTGLTREVEDGIVNRESEREEIELQLSLRRIADLDGENGYSFPSGVLSAGALELYQKHEDAKLTTSRDVMVKSFDLAQKNTELTITSAVTFEGQKKSFSAEEKKLLLEAARAKPEIAAVIFKAQVEYANVFLARYNAIATRANALAEIFKAETGLYIADSEVQKNVVDSSVKKFTAEVSATAEENDANYKSADLILKQFVEFITLRLEAMKNITAVNAQIAASALTGVSASASLSAASSASDSSSVSNNNNYSYDMTKGIPSA